MNSKREWVHSQRLYYKKLKAGKKNPLTNERLLKLADVGFVFDATKRRGNHVSETVTVGKTFSTSRSYLASATAASNVVNITIPQPANNINHIESNMLTTLDRSNEGGINNSGHMSL